MSRTLVLAVSLYMSMSLCNYVSVPMSVSVFVFVSVGSCVSLDILASPVVYVYICLFLSVSMCFCVFASLCVCGGYCDPVTDSVDVAASVSVCVSAYVATIGLGLIVTLSMNVFADLSSDSFVTGHVLSIGLCPPYIPSDALPFAQCFSLIRGVGPSMTCVPKVYHFFSASLSFSCDDHMAPPSLASAPGFFVSYLASLLRCFTCSFFHRLASHVSPSTHVTNLILVCIFR